MRLPAFLDGVPRPVLLLGIPIVAFAVMIGVSLARPDDEAEKASGARAVDVTISVVQTPPADTLERNTEIPQALAPEPAPAAPEPVLNDRGSCNEIRGTDYRTAAEREWFLRNCAGTAAAAAPSAPRSSTTAPLVGSAPGGIRGSADRLVVQRLGINAPVNYRTVPVDGQLGDPTGPYDVVWYDFVNFSGLGGYPGEGGNAVLAGHVDYRTVGAAVFYNLRNVAIGDVIQYRRSDGQVVSYSVSSIQDIPPGADNWTSIVASGGGEAITLITCNGTFDNATREYSLRRVVRAVRI